MRKPKKVSNTSLIYRSLEYLKETSRELLNLGADIVFNPRKLFAGKGIYRDYNQYPFYKRSYDLKKSSYFVEKNDKIYLATKGRIKIIKDIIKQAPQVKRWNGTWMAIIFDIPEKRRGERNFLRKELKWLGFKELQHSVWIFPFNIKRELIALLTLWKIDFEGDIRILIINQIIEDKDFLKFFKLKRYISPK